MRSPIPAEAEPYLERLFGEPVPKPEEPIDTTLTGVIGELVKELRFLREQREQLVDRVGAVEATLKLLNGEAAQDDEARDAHPAIVGSAR